MVLSQARCSSLWVGKDWIPACAGMTVPRQTLQALFRHSRTSGNPEDAPISILGISSSCISCILLILCLLNSIYNFLNAQL